MYWGYERPALKKSVLGNSFRGFVESPLIFILQEKK